MSWVDSGGNVYITSGNVGIGTSTPDAPLDVEVGANAEAFRLTRTDTNAPRLKFGFHPTTGFAYLQANRDNYGDQPLLLNPNGANVGVNTNNPAAVLDVVGDVRASQSVSTPNLLTQSGDLTITPAGGYVVVTAGKTLRVTTVGTASGDLTLSPAGNVVVASGKVLSADTLQAPTLGTGSGDLTLSPTGSYVVVASGKTLRVSTLGTASGDLTLSPAGNVVVASGKVLMAAAGTQAAPAVTLGGDTATGLYRPAANQVGIAISGQAAPVFFVDSNGRVGIGTASPGAPLHVVGASQDKVLAEGSAANYNAYLAVRGHTSIQSQGGVRFLNAAGEQVAVLGTYLNATNPELTLGSSGGVTINPAADLTLNPGGSVVMGDGKVLKAAAGTQAAPSITLGGDSATGIYCPGTNSLVV